MDAGDRIDVLSRAPQTIAGHSGYGVALTPDAGAYLADGPTGDEPGVAAWGGTRLLASGLTAGGTGTDVPVGGAGADRLTGGSGRDRLSGGPGNDVLDARDHHGGDVVRCGSGRDRALADRGDRVSRDCESVRRR